MKNLKTRLLWFGVGILVGGAVISHFVWRGLRSDRYALVYDTKLKLAALEARVLKLEAVSFPKSNPTQVTPPDDFQLRL
ncbi:hypothetical protein I3843_14G045800 [Carya illinoinensis]|nr:hypothetical protein I3760_14G047400 [Carya illinoinensis]KAG7946556.1 hypothetical protein I3843_14G045800 [Carya illinoinensis]